MIARRRRWLLSAIYSVAGAVSIYLALRFGSSTAVAADWPVLVAFAATFVALSLRSVEVNDRMLISASGMVVITGGVFFAASGLISGDEPAGLLAVTLIASAGFLGPGDLSWSKVWKALANFGQIAVSGFAAGLVLDTVLSPSMFARVLAGSEVVPGDIVSPRVIALFAAGAVSGAIVYGILNIVLVRVAVLILYGRTSLVPWAHVGQLIGVLIVQASIGGLLGLVLAAVQSIALVAIMLGMFVVSHLAFSSYATLRATHEAMLKGFVKILETRDLYTRGHTERVAEFALAIGRELGFSDTQLARLRWAALIHDVGKLAVPTAIMRKQGALTGEEFHEMRVATHRVDDLLSEVDFLAPMVTICSGVHPRLDLDEDFGQTGHTHSLRATREQSVLAVADAFDAMTSTRSYRMAMNQRTALERLTATNDPLFHPEVLSALGSALSRMPGSYGPPDLASAEAVRA